MRPPFDSPPILEQCEQLSKTGRFAEALRLIRTITARELQVGLARDVLLSELLQKTGDSQRAAEVASRIVEHHGADAVQRSRCHIVIADTLRDCGRLSEAISEFQRAIALADGAANLRLRCWAELRLLATSSEYAGPEAVNTVLPGVRKSVANLGDPAVTAALHVFVAEIETKRGLYDSVYRHLRLAKTLCAEGSDLWLRSLAVIAELCVRFLESDLDKAERLAHEACRLGRASGHAVTLMAGMSNLGHIYLAKGRLGDATASLEQAFSYWGQGGGAAVAILDGLAQVCLSRGDLDCCESNLKRAEGLVTPARDAPSYYEACTLATQARLLLRKGLVAEARALTLRSAATTAAMSLPVLANTLRLLSAEAAAEVGRLDEAADLIYGAACGHDEPSVDLLTEIARVSGVAIARSGDPTTAATQFDRATRILTSVGNVSARAQVLASAQRALGESPTPDAPGPPLPVTPATVIQRAAAIIDLGTYPEVAGQELLALVIDTIAASEAALVVGNPGHRQVLACAGCDADRAAALASSRRTPVRIPLGTWHDRPHELVATPAPGVAPRATLVALDTLVRSARWLRKARREERERSALWPAAPPGETGQEVFVSQQMTEIVGIARRIAPTGVPVLITGETGTGKEVIARLIHRASSRADRPFMPFNCTAVPRDMLDSQLFGYRRGAFTGATTDFPGVIRAAAGGTLFLDEIGELGHDVQPKLLRFLESGEIHPLGEPRPTRVEVRIIASTNADLDRLVAEGRFREDLYYRLIVIHLELPPLRERREEIPPFVEHFLRLYGEEFQKRDLRVADETMEYLLLHRWPGNVRQLANELRGVVALAENGAVLMPEHLSPRVTAGRRTVPADERQLAPTEVVVRLDQPLPAAHEHLDRAAIAYALKSSGGRLDPAAAMLGLSRKGLYLKRQRLGLDEPEQA